MPLAVDITWIGDEALEKQLEKLAGTAQRKVVRRAITKSGKRIKLEIVKNLSGSPVKQQTGALLREFKRMRVRAPAKRNRRVIQRVLPLPGRVELGINLDDNVYYPAAVEYGHSRAPAKRYIRDAVDDNATREKALIAKDIRAGIIAEAKKAAGKK